MGDYVIEDPELIREKPADDQGRVTLGVEYANKRVKVVLEEVIGPKEELAERAREVESMDSDELTPLEEVNDE